MNVTSPNPSARRKYWKKHIEAWSESGLSQKQYCKDFDLKFPTFCYWRQKLKIQKKKSRLRLVPLEASAEGQDQVDTPTLELRFADCVLVIQTGTPATDLKTVIAALRSN